MGQILCLPVARPVGLRQAHRYGGAAGIDVVLFTDAEPQSVAPLRLSVVVPPLSGMKTLAVLPNSDDGRAEADVIGAAVLRTLQPVEVSDQTGGAA